MQIARVIMACVLGLALGASCSPNDSHENTPSGSRPDATYLSNPGAHPRARMSGGPYFAPIPSATVSATEDEPLFKITVGDKFGFINSTGQIAIKPQFEEAADFHEGLAAVLVQRGDSSHAYGYIDKSGAYAVEPRFKIARDFSEGLALVMEDGAWSYIDKEGNVVFSVFVGGYAADFSDGLALFTTSSTSNESKWGFFNTKGEIAIAAEFDGAESFSEGYAAACIRDKVEGNSEGYSLNPVPGKWGFIDTSGAWVIEPVYWDCRSFSEGLATVQFAYPSRAAGWCYIDVRGNVVIQTTFESIASFSEGLADVRDGDSRRYIDKAGAVVTYPIYERALPFSEGLAAVGTDCSWEQWCDWVYIDTAGRQVFPLTFDYASSFKDGLAAVVSHEVFAYIDKTGSAIWKSYDDSRYPVETGGM